MNSLCLTSLPVTVIVPTKNESRNLADCLESVRDFDQVVVVDSNSNDDTTSIAACKGAEVVHFDWSGEWPKKRNWALQHVDVRNEWVLFLDADERLTPEFVSEMIVKIDSKKWDGFVLRYEYWFLGRRLRYGERMRKLALFKAAKGEYEKLTSVDYSGLDMEVHEHVIVDGNVGEIKCMVKHEDQHGVNNLIRKLNAYTEWEIQVLKELKNRKNRGNLTRRHQVKYAFVLVPFAPVVYWFYYAIFRGGFMDGSRGFIYHTIRFLYFVVLRAKWIENRNKNLV